MWLRHEVPNALEAEIAEKAVIDAKTLKQSSEVKEAKLAKKLEQCEAKALAERIAAAAITLVCKQPLVRLAR